MNLGAVRCACGNNSLHIMRKEPIIGLLDIPFPVTVVLDPGASEQDDEFVLLRAEDLTGLTPKAGLRLSGLTPHESPSGR